jgi:hypothetical protein
MMCGARRLVKEGEFLPDNRHGNIENAARALGVKRGIALKLMLIVPPDAGRALFALYFTGMPVASEAVASFERFINKRRGRCLTI